MSRHRWDANGICTGMYLSMPGAPLTAR